MNEQLINDHIKFAYWKANKWFKKSTITIDDCVSICLEGLCLAAKRYKKEKGTQFTTYADVTIDSMFKKEFRHRSAKKRQGHLVSLDFKLMEEDGEDFSIQDTIGVHDDYTMIHYFDVPLSEKESNVLSLRLEGLTQKEIGEELSISQSHVGRLLEKIRRKMGDL